MEFVWHHFRVVVGDRNNCITIMTLLVWYKSMGNYPCIPPEGVDSSSSRASSEPGKHSGCGIMLSRSWWCTSSGNVWFLRGYGFLLHLHCRCVHSAYGALADNFRTKCTDGCKSGAVTPVCRNGILCHGRAHQAKQASHCYHPVYKHSLSCYGCSWCDHLRIGPDE